MQVIKPNYYDEQKLKFKNDKEIEKLIKIGEIYERIFNFSNLDVVHKLLSRTESVKFIRDNEIMTTEEENLCSVLNGEESLGEMLIDIQFLFITLAQHRKIPIWKRLLFIKKYANLLEKKLEKDTYYKGFLKVLYRNIEDIRVSLELENLPVSLKAKYITLNSLFSVMESITSSQEKLTMLFEKNNLFQTSTKRNPKILEQINKEWQRFIKSKETVFEQYIVYCLFSYFIQDYLQNHLKIEINLLIVYLSIIKYALQVTWYANNKRLSQKEMEEIILELTILFRKENQFEIELKKLTLINDLDDLACCSILLR